MFDVPPGQPAASPFILPPEALAAAKAASEAHNARIDPLDWRTAAMNEQRAHDASKDRVMWSTCRTSGARAQVTEALLFERGYIRNVRPDPIFVPSINTPLYEDEMDASTPFPCGDSETNRAAAAAVEKLRKRRAALNDLQQRVDVLKATIEPLRIEHDRACKLAALDHDPVPVMPKALAALEAELVEAEKTLKNGLDACNIDFDRSMSKVAADYRTDCNATSNQAREEANAIFDRLAADHARLVLLLGTATVKAEIDNRHPNIFGFVTKVENSTCDVAHAESNGDRMTLSHTLAQAEDFEYPAPDAIHDASQVIPPPEPPKPLPRGNKLINNSTGQVSLMSEVK